MSHTTPAGRKINMKELPWLGAWLGFSLGVSGIHLNDWRYWFIFIPAIIIHVLLKNK